jgi:hypothetical protein
MLRPASGSRASSKKIREGVHVRIGFIQIGGFGMAAAAAAMMLGAPAFAQAPPGTPPHGETFE